MGNGKKFLWDENGNIQFDFSNALDVFEPHELASLYSEYLSDVDFVLEEEEKIICMEYKNANIKNAEKPEAFQKKVSGEEYWKKIAKKFYGTMFLVWACDKNKANKPVEYVLLMESNPGMDEALKKKFTAKMMSHLPFGYKNRKEVQKRVINEFSLVDLNEWKERYPQYPVYEK